MEGGDNCPCFTGRDAQVRAAAHLLLCLSPSRLATGAGKPSEGGGGRGGPLGIPEVFSGAGGRSRLRQEVDKGSTVFLCSPCPTSSAIWRLIWDNSLIC